MSIWRTALYLGCTLALGMNSVLADTLSKKDAAFVRKAAIGGLTEVEQSKAAKVRATDAAVKSFADTMIADHGAANERLKALAKSHAWMLPNAVDDVGRAKMSDLSTRKGKSFDQAYANNMKKDHDDAVALFEDAAANVSDPELREFATQTLPTLKHHQEMAHALDGAK